ncbi:glycerol kinase 3-like isoform X2 [Mya arenaria]|uniref:glycerol kinase 3-like isoform X2 n=1 Tax=Mya arenaria TaxID=6604 RepID=UPI0022E8101B|nr:glycerol kinase 3-like isoform X2 [Mya arenaria]
MSASSDLIGSIDQGTSSTSWCEEDPLEILQSVHVCIEKAVDNLKALGISPERIKGIGLTNQRETIVVWDKTTGKPLYNTIQWLDLRAVPLVQGFIDKTPTKNLDAFRPITGLPIYTSSIIRFRWLVDNVPEVKRAVEEGRCYLGTIDAWLLWNLTGGLDGGRHISDVTNASRMSVMNINTMEWDDSLCEFYGIDKKVLPEITSSAEIYGNMNEGPLKGIPLAGNVGDQQGALLGQLCFKPGQGKITYGTAACLCVNTGERCVKSTQGLITAPAYQLGPDKPVIFLLEGDIPVAGACVRWLRDNLGIIKTAEEVDMFASKVNSTHGCYFAPFFSGLYFPDWENDARGIICGLSSFTRKEHICRAALESVCFQAKQMIDAVAVDAGVQLTSIKVDGGMVASDTLMQLQADISGCDVLRPVMQETTALGAAICAGIALGVWDVESTKQEIRDTFRSAVSSEEREVRFSRWHEAVRRCRHWVPAGSVI